MQRDILDKEIIEIEKVIEPNQKEINKFDKEHEELQKLDRQFYEQIGLVIADKKKEEKDFRDASFNHTKNSAAVKELQYQKDVIYQEAERYLFQVQESERIREEIKDRVNPNLAKIQNCKALKAYLEGFLVSSDIGEVKQVTYSKNKEAAALISAIRAPAKKKKGARNQKANQQNLSHSLATIQQFTAANVNPPRNVSEIPDLLKSLQEQIDQLEVTFINVEVTIDIQPDGKVVFRSVI